MLQHKSAISLVVLEGWNISMVSLDTKPDRSLVILMKSVLFPRAVGRVQYLLQPCRNPDINFFVGKAIYCKFAWQVGCLSAPATVAEMRSTLVTEKRLCGVIGTEVALTFLGSMAVNTMIMGGHDFGRIAQRHLSSKKKVADE